MPPTIFGHRTVHASPSRSAGTLRLGPQHHLGSQQHGQDNSGVAPCDNWMQGNPPVTMGVGQHLDRPGVPCVVYSFCVRVRQSTDHPFFPTATAHTLEWSNHTLSQGARIRRCCRIPTLGSGSQLLALLQGKQP